MCLCGWFIVIISIIIQQRHYFGIHLLVRIAVDVNRFRAAESHAGTAALTQTGIHFGNAFDDLAPIALYGQAVAHMKQPTQVEYNGAGARFTTATTGSRLSSFCENSMATLAAAPEAWETVSGISLGAWHAPARKIPAVLVSTGFNLGCPSAKNLWAS